MHAELFADLTAALPEGVEFDSALDGVVFRYDTLAVHVLVNDDTADVVLREAASVASDMSSVDDAPYWPDFADVLDAAIAAL